MDCTSCLTSWVPLKWRPVAPLCRVGIEATGMANPLREQPDTKTEARRQQGPQPGRNQGARWGVQKEQTSADRLERLVGTGGPTLPGQLAPPLYRLPGRSARARKAGACTGLAGQPIGGGGGDDARRLRGKHGHVTDSPAPGTGKQAPRRCLS